MCDVDTPPKSLDIGLELAQLSVESSISVCERGMVVYKKSISGRERGIVSYKSIIAVVELNDAASNM